jgi:hypothetical protein
VGIRLEGDPVEGAKLGARLEGGADGAALLGDEELGLDGA